MITSMNFRADGSGTGSFPFRVLSLPQIRPVKWGFRAFGWMLAAVICCGALGCAEGMPFSRAEDPQAAGLKLYEQHNYAEAAGSFRNAITKDPREYKSYYYLAVTYDAMQAYQQAIESYKSALDVMKVTYAGKEDAAFRVKVMDGLAITIAKIDTNDLETNMLEQKATASQKAMDFFQLAKIFRYRGDPDTALDDYKRAMLLDDKNFFIAKEYGLYLEQLGQRQQAQTVLSHAGALNGTDQDVSAALRRLGVVPGPSLKESKDLATPAIPEGPIPPLDIQKLKQGLGMGGGSKPAATPPTAPSAPAEPAASVQAPRD